MRTSLVLALALTTLGSTACSGFGASESTGDQSSALRGDPMYPLPLPPQPTATLAATGPVVVDQPPRVPGGIFKPAPASLYGTITGYAGTPGTVGHDNGPVQTSFGHPKFLATARAGLTWVVDLDDEVQHGRHAKSCLRLVQDTGRGVATHAHVQTSATSGYFDANSVGGVAVDPSSGDLIMSIDDVRGPVILKVTLAGDVSVIAGYNPPPTHSPNLPSAPLVPPASFYDAPIDPNGRAHPFDARFNGPAGIARDAQGNLFVADTNNHAIRKITPEGDVSTVATDASVSPTSLAIDARDGSLYTSSGHAVYRVIPGATSATGQMNLWAGNPTTAGYQDSLAQLSAFSSPQGLAVDRSGNVYVADTGNAKIRKIVPADGSPFSMTTVTTISFHPFSTQLTFDGYGPDDDVLQAPAALSFWGDALVMSDTKRGTVRVLY